MNITKKIIITDTNIITDLNNAQILEKFISLDNVYISDLIKNDEINTKTGNTNIIKKFKIITSTAKELQEVSVLSTIEKKLSIYDLLNYVLARDNNAIIATGDNRLKIYSEKNNIEVIRTLKIIKLMHYYHIISTKETITACKLLRNNPYTRIPIKDIDSLIKVLEKESSINT